MTFPQLDSGSAQHGPRADEKSSSPATTTTTTSTTTATPRLRALRMPSGRRLLFFFALAVFFGLACVAAYPPNRQVNAGFEDLLAKVSDASLHELHEFVSDKYKHGVYSEDRTGVQAAHHDDAATTPNLVELVPRQNLNSSSSSASKQSATSSSSRAPTGSSSSLSVVSSSSPLVSSVSTTTPTTPATSSTPNSSGSSTSTSYTISSTSQAQSASSSAPPTDTTPTTPSEGPLSTSQVIYTTTLQDGQTSTITSVAVVGGGGGGGGAMGNSNVGGPTSTTGTPSLQNVAAKGGRGLGLVEAIVLAAAMSLITL